MNVKSVLTLKELENSVKTVVFGEEKLELAQCLRASRFYRNDTHGSVSHDLTINLHHLKDTFTIFVWFNIQDFKFNEKIEQNMSALAIGSWKFLKKNC